MRKIISNIFSPPKCLFCGTALPVTAKINCCEKCMSELFIAFDRVCSLCGKPIAVPRGDLICSSCRKKRYSFVCNIASFEYKDNVRSAIVRMKFSKNQQWIAVAFGELLAEVIQKKYGDISFDGVTYVPLSSKREMKRGFNQSEIIAKTISGITKIPLLKNTLVKSTDNEKQSVLKAKDREKNVKGVYKAGKVSVEDKVVLLIDDVLTTGATLNECSKVLKKSGAALVYCATAAIT